MNGQGRPLTQDRIEIIVRLLCRSSLTLDKIASRAGVSQSAVVSVNKRLKIRDYTTKRTEWVINGVVVHEGS